MLVSLLLVLLAVAFVQGLPCPLYTDKTMCTGNSQCAWWSIYKNGQVLDFGCRIVNYCTYSTKRILMTHELCDSSSLLCLWTGSECIMRPLPTATPTRLPTKSPTRKPTRLPTNSPTRKPTQNPTRHPTMKPTKHHG